MLAADGLVEFAYFRLSLKNILTLFGKLTLEKVI
jgi:hypothetical protein